jgi:hypothetical protein
VELAPHKQLPKGRLAELYDLNLKDNPDIKKVIETAYAKMADPQRLLDYVEPSFIKYLVGLNRDLSKSRCPLKNQQVEVGSIQPIDIEY